MLNDNSDIGWGVSNINNDNGWDLSNTNYDNGWDCKNIDPDDKSSKHTKEFNNKNKDKQMNEFNQSK